MAEQPKFSCESCGTRYNWKPELAGKRAKCKCGQMMTVPQSIGADEPDLDGLYDLVEDDPPPQRRAAPATAAAAVATTPASGKGMRCPSCSAAIQPGTVVCIACGFNLKTGKKMGTAIASGDVPPPIARPAPGAMPAGITPQFPGGHPPRIGPRQMQASAADAEGQKKVMLLGGVAILIIAGLIGGFVMLKQGGADSDVVYKFEDQEISTKLKEDANTEIKAFLENRMFSVLGMTTSQANGFADNLYKMGAKDVRAFDGRVSMTMVVELPDDAAKRKDIIDHYNRYHQGNPGVRQATDEGQRYLRYRLKIANI